MACFVTKGMPEGSGMHLSAPPRLLGAILLFLVILFGMPGPLPAQALPPVERPFVVLGIDQGTRLHESVDDTSFDAWAQLQEEVGGLRWPGTVHVVWCEDPRDFEARAGARGEHFAAAASPKRRTIWINGPKWRSSAELENRRVMTHEMAHVLMHTLPGGADLPQWAEEGIAMHLAGQWSPVDTARLAQERLMGRLPTLRELEHGFPNNSRVDMAYAVSYFAVELLARSVGDEPGSAYRLVALLSSPASGPRIASDLWDPQRRDGLELGAYHTIGSISTSALIVFTSGTLFWGFIAILLFLAYLKKQRRAEARAKAEEEEEAWAQSLTQADIQDIYGDREDRWDSGDEPSPTATGRKNPWPDAENR